MKTTVDISDRLLNAAKKLASKQGTTVRALIEEGLRRVLSERAQPGGFKLRRATYKGKGLQPEVQEGSWQSIRDLIYEGHGA
jgi:hypothetical protein